MVVVQDPDGSFIHCWVPEAAQLPNKYIQIQLIQLIQFTHQRMH